MRPIANVVVACLFVLGCRKPFVPAEAAFVSEHAVAVGRTAPDARLVSSSGDTVALADVLDRHAQTIVVFYRGFF